MPSDFVTTLLWLLVAIGLVLHVVALVDVVRQPASRLSGVGGRGLWLYLLTIGAIVPGAPLALVYLLAVPKGVAGSTERS